MLIDQTESFIFLIVKILRRTDEGLLNDKATKAMAHEYQGSILLSGTALACDFSKQIFAVTENAGLAY